MYALSLQFPHKTKALLGLAPLNSNPSGQATSSDGKPPASKQLHQAKWSGWAYLPSRGAGYAHPI